MMKLLLVLIALICVNAVPQLRVRGGFVAPKLEPTTEAITESTTEATTAEATTEAATTEADTTVADATTTAEATSAPVFLPCVSNLDCPGTTPYCLDSVCQACITDYDCRTQTRCNSVCVTNNLQQNKCATPVGVTRLVCQVNEVCYRFEATCQRSCIRSGLSDNGDPVPCPAGKVCNTENGVCTPCLINSDCGVSANATCNSKCQYDVPTYQFSCSAATPCSETQSCLQAPATSDYVCSGSASSLVAGMVMLIALVTLVFVM